MVATIERGPGNLERIESIRLAKNFHSSRGSFPAPLVHAGCTFSHWSYYSPDRDKSNLNPYVTLIRDNDDQRMVLLGDLSSEIFNIIKEVASDSN